MRNRGEIITAITEERHRQYIEEGWDDEHDDEHTEGELAMAAACYAAPKPICVRPEHDSLPVDAWPWDGDKKPHPRKRALEISAALIIAELERLERAG
jgi:hypothetical protein